MAGASVLATTLRLEEGVLSADEHEDGRKREQLPDCIEVVLRGGPDKDAWGFAVRCLLPCRLSAHCIPTEKDIVQ